MDKPAPLKELAISSIDKNGKLIFMDCHVDLLHQFAHFGTMQVPPSPRSIGPANFGPRGSYISIMLTVSPIYDFDVVLNFIKEEETASLRRNEEAAGMFDIWGTPDQEVRDFLASKAEKCGIDWKIDLGEQGTLKGEQGTLKIDLVPPDDDKGDDDEVGRIGRFLGLE